jgi:hypothetical protein
MAFAPGVPGPHFMQVAFIVDDVVAAARRWVATAGIGPFLHVPHIELAEYSWRGERRGGLDFSVALAQSGGLQIELVEQHCDSPSAYRDTIARGTQGFHHLAVYCEDYDAAYAHYRDQGFAASVDGKFGPLRFSYIDTSAALGCMVELVEQHESQSEFFQRVAAAAEGWDGVTDPIRPGFPS